MDLKPPKPKKKSNVARLLLKGRMLRTPLLILFLLGSTSCDNDNDSDIDSFTVPTKLFNSSEHVRHRHKLVDNSEVISDRQYLSEIKYLRRHLNKKMVNFVMSDVLVDGEVENRVHYNGLFLKETSVKSHESGLQLRQLTDGNHLLQIIYAQNDIIQDCEVITQPKSARNFLKKLRKEIKTALDEQTYKLQDEPKPLHAGDEKFYRHFENVTFRILKNGAKLPQDLVERMDYEKLKIECLKRHEELMFMLKNKNKIGEQTLSRSRKSLRENFILPGTKWCGAGQLADNYNELGNEKTEDRCCRAHDNCRLNIGAFQRRFGHHNLRFYTISHCRCDRRQKRDAMDILRVPGTKWCGKGYSATTYSQLGGYTRTDRCCRVHDMRCPFWIGGMEKKYGIYNWRVNTLMHCRCDERFRACLKLADTSVSNLVGNLFFNVLQTQCFVLKPVKMCTQRSWWGTCLQKRRKRQAFIRNNLPY